MVHFLSLTQHEPVTLITLNYSNIEVFCRVIKPVKDLLVGEDRWADKVSECIFDHVLHQVGAKHFLIIYQERCLNVQEKVRFVVSFYPIVTQLSKL